MTRTTWTEALHPREANGKFDTKEHSTPELDLNVGDEMADFMLSGAPEQKPFTPFTPVIVTLNGEAREGVVIAAYDTHAIVSSREDYNGVDPFRHESVNLKDIEFDHSVHPDAVAGQKEAYEEASRIAGTMQAFTVSQHNDLEHFTEHYSRPSSSYHYHRDQVERAVGELQERGLYSEEFVESFYGLHERLPELDSDGYDTARHAQHAAIVEVARRRGWVDIDPESTRIVSEPFELATIAHSEYTAARKRVKNVRAKLNKLTDDDIFKAVGELHPDRRADFLEAVERSNRVAKQVAEHIYTGDPTASIEPDEQNPDFLRAAFLNAASVGQMGKYTPSGNEDSDYVMDVYDTIIRRA